MLIKIGHTAVTIWAESRGTCVEYVISYIRYNVTMRCNFAPVNTEFMKLRNMYFQHAWICLYEAIIDEVQVFLSYNYLCSAARGS